MATARRTIKIDVISDFVCAWCYIGHLELEQGIALAKARNLPVDFQVQYHPFILNSSLPDKPIPKEQYYLRKFGPAKATEVRDLLSARGKQEGVDFKFSGNVRQTVRAHRLLQKAFFYGGQKAQSALIRRLFRAFFEDGQDIGDPATLAKLATSQTYPFSPPSPLPTNGVNGTNGVDVNGHGNAHAHTVTLSDGTELDFDPHEDDDAAAIFDTEEEALAWIEGSDLEKEVHAMSMDAARKGVAGVPFTVIDGRWAVSGCQKPECYAKIFEKLASNDPACHYQCPNGTSSSSPTSAAVHKITICKSDDACPVQHSV